VARIALLAATDRVAASVRPEHELALLREQLRIKDARMARLPPQRRPHYPAVDRPEILEIRAARGWSAVQTAERFFVTEATVASWVMRLDEDGPSALVWTTVRRMLMRRLRRVAPAATVRSERRIRSSRPNHIWLVDLTTVPSLSASTTSLAGSWVSGSSGAGPAPWR